MVAKNHSSLRKYTRVSRPSKSPPPEVIEKCLMSPPIKKMSSLLVDKLTHNKEVLLSHFCIELLMAAGGNGCQGCCCMPLFDFLRLITNRDDGVLGPPQQQHQSTTTNTLRDMIRNPDLKQPCSQISAVGGPNSLRLYKL